MVAREVADPAVGAAQPIPEAEVEAIIAPITLVMTLMMARRDEPPAGYPRHMNGGKTSQPM